MRLGFVGLGIMGTPMALNLVRGGHEVAVWNRTAAACEPLREAGAKVLASAAAVAANSEITFAMLSDPEAALAVACGPEGICAGLRSGTGYVDMSTVDAETSIRIAVAVAEREARYLEAPVSGTKGPAEKGTLVILAGGDDSLYQEAAPALDLMGKKRVFLGPVGQGARMKLVVNMIMGGMMTAFCEGLALATGSQLDLNVLLGVLEAGALANPMFRGKGPRMAAGEYRVAFPLKHMQKDLRLALAQGAELAVPLPTAAAANEKFLEALDAGDGDLDFSAVWRVWHK